MTTLSDFVNSVSCTNDENTSKHGTFIQVTHRLKLTVSAVLAVLIWMSYVSSRSTFQQSPIAAILQLAANIKRAGHNSTDTVVVHTQLGSVRGVLQDGLRYFHGVPYAEPPIGDLRWRRPRPVAAWTFEYDATTIKASCPQHCDFGVVCSLKQSENCLYLEIVTPALATNSSRLPVDVYLHGGTFTSMSATSPLYDPARIVQKTGIILVKVEYRLGALAFLVTEGTGDDAQGNYGILDQRLALQWIHENIPAFGGDPEKITLHGQSAGSQSVLVHLVSSDSCRYFRSVILESDPLALPYKTLSEAGRQGQMLANILNCTQENEKPDMKCLRQTDAFLVRDSQMVVQSKMKGQFSLLHSFEAWAPVIDGAIVKAHPLIALKNYRESQCDFKPMLLGFTTDEAYNYIREWLQDPAPPAIFSLIKDLLFPKMNTELLYPSTNEQDSRGDIVTVATDAIFRCPLRWTVNQFFAMGHTNIWVYEWAHVFDTPLPRMYQEFNFVAAHGIQVPFVFQSLHAMQVHMLDSDLQMSNAIIAYYATFVQTGNPNGDVAMATVATDDTFPLWSRARTYTQQFSKQVFHAGITTDTVHLPNDQACQAWDQRGYDIDISDVL